ncbi:MAG: hypothetical protein Q7R33_09590 [Nitrosarchaeum sp.]|nr:hypothetical protein [Nitrosarchaeum sp.]
MNLTSEFLKVAIDTEWWKKLTPEQQHQYLLEHRKTKLRPTSERPIPSTTDRHSQSVMTKFFAVAPKSWKGVLLSEGTGYNSKVEQLSDMARPREIKEALTEGHAKVVIGFERDHDAKGREKLKPAFIVKKASYPEHKFNVYAMETKAGKTAEINRPIYNEEQEYQRGRRGMQGRYFTRRESDLRITPLIDKLVDKPYAIFAVQIDEQKMALHQQRTTMKDVSQIREIQNKMKMNAIKPLYDYYAAEMQANLDKIGKLSVPSMKEILQDRYGFMEKRERVTTNALEELKKFKNKMSSLGASLPSYHSLPTANEPLSGSEWKTRDVKRFLADLHNVRAARKEDFADAIEYKSDNAQLALRNADFVKAYDYVKDIGRKDLAQEIKDFAKTWKTPETLEMAEARNTLAMNIRDELRNERTKALELQTKSA